jgi:hypothetical protein
MRVDESGSLVGVQRHHLPSMAADNRSLRNRWSEFFGSLRMQLGAAFAVGLPADDAARSGDLDADQEREDGLVRGRSVAGDAARRHREDSPGYVTRNGLGSLEVGAFRDRPGD